MYIYVCVSWGREVPWGGKIRRLDFWISGCLDVWLSGSSGRGLLPVIFRSLPASSRNPPYSSRLRSLSASSRSLP